jgi:hypothetical protein
VKVDPKDLPRRENLHWLGQHAFETLPRLAAAWDVCMMPFALNEATRHISPTKTLEYMAAGKPIVSTPIRDVAEPYAPLVRIGDGAAQFVEACEDALAESAAQRDRRSREMRELSEDLCWDDTAAAMEAIVFGPRPAWPEPPVSHDEVTISLDDPGGIVVAHPGNARVVAIEAPARRLRLEHGASLRYDTLNANVPLPQLVELLGTHAPRGVREAAAYLREQASGDVPAADSDVRFAHRIVRIHNWLATVDIRPSLPTPLRSASPLTREAIAR